MYLEHFSLKEFPYLPSPDARFLYLSDQVNETLQKCLYMIGNAIGPLYVYGPIGTGKTTLAQRLQQQLEQDPQRYVVAYLVIPPQLTVNALLRLMMEEFKVKTARSYAGGLKHFAAWLLDRHKTGSKPVVILDEAQNLTPTHLKLLHFLLNYETRREKLVQMVLFGQNQLAQKIERFPELKSRMYPAALTAFNRQDTEAMISFPAEVLDALFRSTLGLPRELVKLCDLSLLRTYQEKRTAVTVDDVAIAANELSLTTT